VAPPARLHWDVELVPPVPFLLQGLIYLDDVGADQGAFSCVPGFQHRLEAWLRTLPPGSDPHMQDLDAMGRVYVPGRAGDMVIWHQALPHGASRNTSRIPRLVQYLTYLPLAAV
jgi:ectoine hydroxylase-related dioxygenase (phytanoyl-CoA dioxygenase family)